MNSFLNFLKSSNSSFRVVKNRTKSQRIFLSISLWTVFLSFIPSISFGQAYLPIAVTGFNQDIIANGTGTGQALTSTTAIFDLAVVGGQHVFYSKDFKGTANPGIAPPYGLDITQTIASAANVGTNYSLASFTGNNALLLASAQTGTLTFNTPIVLDKISILATSLGVPTATAKVTFTDASFTDYPIAIPDWNTSAGAAKAGIGRVARIDDGGGVLADAFDGDATKPNLFDCIINLSAADKLKLVKSITFSGITANTAFFGVCGIVAAGVPVAPTVNASTLITSTGFTANWGTVSGALNYRIDISKDADFSTFVGAYNNFDAGTGTSLIITGLENTTTYYFRMRAENLAGQSISSINSTVTTSVPAPAIPTLGATTNITATGFDINWSAVAGATNYRLDISTVNNFASFVPGFISKDVANVITYPVAGLQAGTTYYYRLRAENAGGQSLNSTVPEILTLPAAPAVSAASLITATSFQANWSASASATKYWLDVSTDIAFGSFVEGFNNLDVTTNIQQSVIGLTAGLTYHYRIKAENATGSSAYSAIITVSTIAGAPVASAATLLTTTGFQANWGAIAGALKYRLDISTDIAFGSFVGTYNNLDVGLVTSYAVSGLQAGTSYFYRLRAENGSGPGPNSNIMNTITLPLAPVASAATLVKSTSFQANWAASIGATKYRIDVSTVNTFASFVTGYNNLDVGNVLTFPITGLTYNTNYFYRVRAEHTQGVSANSTNIAVTTTPPEAVTLAQVGIDAITLQITNTLIDFQYCTDSTLTNAGTWKDCIASNTPVVFSNGGFDIWVRQKNLISNKRKVANLPARINLASGVSYNLLAKTISGLNNNEQYRMDNGGWLTVVTNVTFVPGKFEVHIPATLTTLESSIEVIGDIKESEIAFTDIQRYVNTKNADNLTIETLVAAEASNVNPNNLDGYKTEIENATSMTTLSQLQVLIDRSNAFYSINEITVNKNSSPLTIVMFTTAGVTDARAGYLQSYKDAIVYYNPFSNLPELQKFIHLMNAMNDISLMAQNDDASMLTYNMLIATEISNVNASFLNAYKPAIEDETAIQNGNQLQSIIDIVNLQQSVFAMATTNNASALTIQMLLEIGIIDAYDVNLGPYKIAIIEADAILNLNELQLLIDKTNAQQYIITKTVLSNPTNFTLDLLIQAGTTGTQAEYLNAYLSALEVSPGLASFADFQKLINKVNLQQLIFAMAVTNNASSLTNQMLIDAGIVSSVLSSLSNYKAGIIAKDEINNLAELQAIIDGVNLQLKIFAMAVSNNTSELTIEMLQQAGVMEVYEENFAGYKNGIMDDTEIKDLPELQSIIDKVNAQQLILSKNILNNRNAFTIPFMITAGLTNGNVNYLSFYLDGIEAVETLSVIGDVQKIVDRVNAQQNIFLMASTNNASPLTIELLILAEVSDIHELNLQMYKEAIVAKEAIIDMVELQGIISKVNLQSAIMDMAITNNASALTMEMLQAAGVIDIYDVNLLAYQEAIVAEEAIANIAKVQEIITRTNAQQYLFTKTILSNPSAFTTSMLVTAGVTGSVSTNIPLYISELEASEPLKTLPELQAIINKINAQQLIFNMPVTNDTSLLTIPLLTNAGVTGARTDKLTDYKIAIAGLNSVLDLDALQLIINAENMKLGIKLQAEYNIQIYPIPSRDFVFIQSEKNFTFKLFSNSGILINSSISNAGQLIKLDISNLLPGIHLLIIEIDGISCYRKIIKF